MSPGVKMMLGAFADFFGMLTASVSGAMIQQATLTPPGKGAWILGILLGAGAFWSHIATALREPPK